MTIEKKGPSFWMLLNKSEARLLFTQSNLESCQLHDDNSASASPEGAESVIETRQDLERILADGLTVGVFLGASNK